jgi:hypothetical protein
VLAGFWAVFRQSLTRGNFWKPCSASPSFTESIEKDKRMDALLRKNT